MVVNINKIKIVASTALVITLISSKAYAFGIPLLSADLQRLISSIKVTMNEIMIIKQEVESNMRIIKEIKNGGFAAAGAMIFEKIQSGDYDRFGQALTNVKSEGQDMSANIKARKDLKAREEELRKQGMSEKEAQLQAQEEMRKELEQERIKRMQAAEGRKMIRGENAGQKAYNWLKSNEAFTGGTSSALRGVANGNVGQIVGGSLGATGGAVGNNTVGNILGSSSTGAGRAVNSAVNGDIGGVIGNISAGAGAGIGAGTGSQGLGNVVSGVGNVAGGVYTGASNADNIGGFVSGIASNGQIGYGLNNISGGTQQMEDAKKAALEAQKKEGEEMRKKNQQAFDEYQKYLKEKEEAEKKAAEEQRLRGIEQVKEDAKKECLSCRKANGEDAFVCSFSCGVAGL